MYLQFFFIYFLNKNSLYLLFKLLKYIFICIFVLIHVYLCILAFIFTFSIYFYLFIFIDCLYLFIHIQFLTYMFSYVFVCIFMQLFTSVYLSFHNDISVLVSPHYTLIPSFLFFCAFVFTSPFISLLICASSLSLWSLSKSFHSTIRKCHKDSLKSFPFSLPVCHAFPFFSPFKNALLLF